MKIKTELVKGKDLKPGDLFSTRGDDYWQHLNSKILLSLGEKVYIRTEAPLPSIAEGEEQVYRITIEKGDEK